MTKDKFTQDELRNYIRDYKSQVLESANTDSNELFKRANDIDIAVGNQLIALSSAFVTIIGAFVATQITSVGWVVKCFLSLSVILFLASILHGIKSLFDRRDFWIKVADHKHKEGALVLEDNSLDYDDLVIFRDELMKYRQTMPNKSNDNSQRYQLKAFLIGIVALAVSIVTFMATSGLNGLGHDPQPSHSHSLRSRQ